VLQAFLALWKRREQVQGCGKLGDRLLIGTALQGILPRVMKICDGAPGIVSTHKMHRQLRGDLPRLHPIARLLAGPDLLMQAHPVPGGHARIHHLVI
jgi:hypothetical protein